MEQGLVAYIGVVTTLAVPVVGWIAGPTMVVVSLTVLEDNVKSAQSGVSSAKNNVNYSENWLQAKTSDKKKLCQQSSLSRFGVKLWNEMPCHIRDLPKKKFRKVLHRLLSDILKREDDYIETPLIVEKVRLIVS